jgi:hypothetical protein
MTRRQNEQEQLFVLWRHYEQSMFALPCVHWGNCRPRRVRQPRFSEQSSNPACANWRIGIERVPRDVTPTIAAGSPVSSHDPGRRAINQVVVDGGENKWRSPRSILSFRATHRHRPRTNIQTVNKLNDDDTYRKFYVQRTKAVSRGIRFLLTFEQWRDIWTESGHWHERGRGKANYVMARKGHAGPYEVKNVRIITQAQSISAKVWSAETRAKLRNAIARNRAKLIAARWPRHIERKKAA